MTRAEQTRIWLENRRMQTALKAVWQPRITFALKQQVREFTAFMLDQGIDLALSQIEIVVKPDPIRRVLTALYRAVFPRSANITAGRLKERYGQELTQEKAFGTPNAYWLVLVQEFMLSDGATKVTEITETTREFIRRTINRMLEDGSSIHEIARALISSSINVSRGRLIARTELTNVTNMGAQAAARRAGIMLQKIWISARDNRTRRIPRDKFDHLEMDNKTAMMNEPFNVSGELMQHPGDPAGSAGNVCNCRCTIAHEAVRNEAGQLIRTPVLPASSIFVQQPQRPGTNITQVVTI